MSEKPILFSAPMVRAILNGSKTVTRRVVKDTGLYAIDASIHGEAVAKRELVCLATQCPYGQPGDRLWVREAFSNLALPGYPECFVYRADGTHSDGDGIGDSLPDGCRWKPSIHMPRKACRMELEITSVRCERLQSITEEQAKAEGVELHCTDRACLYCHGYTARQAFQELWTSINGQESWDANPWVWAVSFRKIKGGQP